MTHTSAGSGPTKVCAIGPKVIALPAQAAACTRLPSLSPLGTPRSPTSFDASPGTGRPRSPVSFHTTPKPAPLLHLPPQSMVPLRVTVLPATAGAFMLDGLGESARAPSADAATKTPPMATDAMPASTRDPERPMAGPLPPRSLHAQASARSLTLPKEGACR